MAARLLFIALLFISCSSLAQTFSLTGRIVDAADTTGLINVSVALKNEADSSLAGGTITNEDGSFMLGNIAPGRYDLKLVYIGYTTITRKVEITATGLNLGTIKMTTLTKELKSVTVAGTQT